MGKIVGVLGIVVLVGALAVWKMTGKSEEGKMAPNDTKGMAGSSLKAGEKQLSTKTSYTNPSGSDEVGFKVTVDASGVVTDAMVDILAVNGISKTRQEKFAEGFSQALKGKKLSELTAIDKVGGSSLTTAAFNTALPQLKAQL